jgi:hypothetical protein
MKILTTLVVGILFLTQFRLHAQTTRLTTNTVVTKPTEGMVLTVACDPNGFSNFTNLLHSYLKDSKSPTNDVSQLLFNLLAGRLAYGSPQLKALIYMHSIGADLKYESDVNAQGDTIYIPLHVAIMRGKLETVKWLVDSGADINQIEKKTKSTALENAVVLGRKGLEILEWLVNQGARPQEEKTGRSLFVAALRQPQYQDLNATFPLLLKAGANPYFQNDDKKTAVDILADERDLAHLREIDTKGIYRSLLNQYTAPKDSPFIGVWSSHDSDGSMTIILNRESMAFIVVSPMFIGGPVPWRTLSKNQAGIWMRENGKGREIIVEWLSTSNCLQFLDEGKLKGKPLSKSKEAPPTTEEFLKMLRLDGK